MAPPDLLSLALEGVAAASLALMCYQDWQARSISWPAFPVLGASLLGRQLLQQPAAEVGWQLAVNGLLIALLLALLALYVRLRFRPVGLRLFDCLGSGDVLYWLVVASCFSPAGFLVYFLVSAMAALVAALLLTVLTRWRRAADPGPFRVPLAGIQATCLLLLLAGQHLHPTWNNACDEAERQLTFAFLW